MKRKSFPARGCLLGLLLGAMALAGPARAREVSVQVRESVLRERPSFLGAPSATVTYTDRLEVLSESPPWVRVRGAPGEGWIHQSAVTRKRLVMRAGEEDLAAEASGEELALAGKGFNQAVEAEYREAHPGLDFSAVDAMEASGVSAGDMARFLRAGNVGPAEATP